MGPGETMASGASRRCGGCGKIHKVRVLQSGAGYYVGAFCCQGPYSRETGYFGSPKEAERVFLQVLDAEYERLGLTRKLGRDKLPMTANVIVDGMELRWRTSHWNTLGRL